VHVNFVIFGGWSGYMLDRKIKHVAIFLKKSVETARMRSDSNDMVLLRAH
jgi:hypothetical protein